MNDVPEQKLSVQERMLAVLERIEEMLANRFNPNHTLRHHLATRAKDGKPNEL